MAGGDGKAGGVGGERGGKGGVKEREAGDGVVEWVGAKYTREQLMELAKSPAALRRPHQIPLQFCRNEPGNLAERSMNERAARKKADREREKERKEKGPKGGRETKGEGDIMGRGDFGSARPAGATAGSGAGRGATTAEDRHRLMMEEVERERAAFAAARNQQRAEDVARRTAAGVPEGLDKNRSVFDGNNAPSARPSAVPDGSSNENGQGILNMLFEGRRGGDDDIDAGMGDMSLQIPLPSVVPPEASPSKFATSRAGRWFSPANDAPGGEGGGLAFSDSVGAEIPSAVANLWGSPQNAHGRAEAQANQLPPGASPMAFPAQVGQQGAPDLGSGMLQPGMFASPPPGPPVGSAPTPQSTLSQLLNINANASTQAQNSTPTQGFTDQAKMNLPPPVAPLVRPGNSLLSKLLDGGGVAGGGRPPPQMPQRPMMSAADIERQLLGAASGGSGQAPNLGGAPSGGPGTGGQGAGFNVANFFAQFQGAGGAGQQPQPGQGSRQHLGGPHVNMQPGIPPAVGPGGPGIGQGVGIVQGMGGVPGRGMGGMPLARPPAAGGAGRGVGGAGFDAGSFFKQFEGAASQNPLPPMPAQAAQSGAWGAVPAPR